MMYYNVLGRLSCYTVTQPQHQETFVMNYNDVVGRFSCELNFSSWGETLTCGSEMVQN